jgi:rod shape-determining protein MreC
MLAFLRRNQVLLSSFLCLLLSLYILAAAARGQLKADPIGPLLLELLRPFQIVAHVTLAKVRHMAQGYATRNSLITENEKLRGRVQGLEEERNRLLEAEATNRRLRELLELRSQLPATSVTATVIGNSASTWFHSFTLDKGHADGLQKGMGVVTPVGVVGQVVDTTSRSAKVLLVTDPYSGVDVIVQRSRARGIVSGSVDNGPIVKYVKRSEDIQEGDRLMTSGLDGIFPKGLLVGTVGNVRKKSFGLFQHVTVNLAVDPSRIEEVLVVAAETEGSKD